MSAQASATTSAPWPARNADSSASRRRSSFRRRNAGARGVISTPAGEGVSVVDHTVFGLRTTSARPPSTFAPSSRVKRAASVSPLARSLRRELCAQRASAPSSAPGSLDDADVVIVARRDPAAEIEGGEDAGARPRCRRRAGPGDDGHALPQRFERRRRAGERQRIERDVDARVACRNASADCRGNARTRSAPTGPNAAATRACAMPSGTPTMTSLASGSAARTRAQSASVASVSFEWLLNEASVR